MKGLNNLTVVQKVLLEKGEHLPIMEDFYTIQGEGFNSGGAAYFIRIGGCDVGCHWCDVKESWDASLHPLIAADSIIDKIKLTNAKDIVITGGEPSIYNMDYLCKILHENQYQTFIETSGAHPFSGKWDWVCLSPKKNMPPKQEVYELAHELKVIVFNKNDFKWAEEHAEKVGAKCRLFLQPEWSKRETMIPQIVDYVMNNPKWSISLQTHKIMHIP